MSAKAKLTIVFKNKDIMTLYHSWDGIEITQENIKMLDLMGHSFQPEHISWDTVESIKVEKIGDENEQSN